MNKLNFLGILVLVLALAGCSKTIEETKTDPVLDAKLEIRADIASMTKAPQLNDDGSGIFSPDDSFTVLTHHAASQSTSTFPYQVGSTTLYWRNLKLPTDRGEVDFHACYPAQSLQEESFVFDLESAEDRDPLLASTKSVSIGTESVVLNFKHVLHKLVIRFYTDASYASADDIETICTARSTCRVNLREGTLDNSSSQKASFTAHGSTATFLIVPQACSEVALTVKVGQDVKTFTLDNLTDQIGQLQSGMQLTMNISVKEGKIQLEEAVIENWGHQGSITGDIIM